MEKILEPIFNQLGLNRKYAQRMFNALDRGFGMQFPIKTINPPVWILLHLTEARCFMLNLVGVKFPAPWGDFSIDDEDLYKMDKYPKISAIADTWLGATTRLMTRLDTMTAEDLAKIPLNPYQPFPIDDGSIVGALTFLVYHEIYHTGQLGSWWKMMGKRDFMS